MAIISEYEEEDSGEVETAVGANVHQRNEEDDEGDEDEDEDYFSSRPSDGTGSERPYDEVLGFLLREHQQQPLDLLSTVIEYLFRETPIASQEGVDGRVSEMLSAAKRRRSDGVEDVFGGPDKIAKLGRIFDDIPEMEKSGGTEIEEEFCAQISEERSKNEGSVVEDKETVIITPVEYPNADIVEEDSEALNVVHVNDDDEDFPESEKKIGSETTIITPAEKVPVTKNLASPEANVDQEKEEDNVEKDTMTQDLDPNSGNGADLEHYSWTQTLTDTTLLLPVPDGTKAKSIVCEIQPRYLKIGLKGEPPLLEGDLNKPVKPSECFWNLEDGKLLAVHLQKHYTMDWWHVILEGEPEIDVEKVHLPHASLSDLHPDTRQHIEHTLFEQQQASKELPSSDEKRKNDVLRKFLSEGLELYN